MVELAVLDTLLERFVNWLRLTSSDEAGRMAGEVWRGVWDEFRNYLAGGG